MRRLQRALAIAAFISLSLSVHALAATNADSSSGQNSSLVQFPNLRGANSPLLFERFGPLAYTPLTFDTGSLISDFPGTQGAAIVANEIASGEAGGLVLLGSVCVAAVEWAFSLDLVGQASGPVTTVVGNLQAELYTRYLPAILVLVAAWLGWTVLARQRLLHGIGGIAWAVLMLVIGALLLAAPAQYLSQANAFSTELSGAVLSGVAADDPALGQPDTTDSQGTSTQNELRLFSNRVWGTWVYDPWTVMEFGQVDPTVQGRQLGVELLQKNSGQSSTYDQDISQAPKSVQDWAAGKDGGTQVTYGGFMLLVALMGAILILLIALSMLGAELVLLMGVILAVPVLLVAPIPGFGRRMFERWFALMFLALAVKVLAALYLVITLSLTAAVNTLEGRTGWLITALLQALTMWVVWHARKAFFHAGRGAMQPSHAATPAPIGQAGAGSLAAQASGSYLRGRLVQARVPALASSAPHAATVARTGTAARGTAMAAKGAAVGGSSIATAGLAAGAMAALKAGQMAVRGHDRARRWTQGQAGQLLHGPVASSASNGRLSHAGHPGEMQVLAEPLRQTWRRFDHAQSRGRLPPPPPSRRNQRLPGPRREVTR